MNLKLAAVVIIALSISACVNKGPAQPDSRASAQPNSVTRPGVIVQTEPLRRMPINGTITANGQVVADGGAAATLAFPTDGQISFVNVNVGDRVARGDVLASLDARLAEDAVRQAQSDVTTAEANLAKVSAGARPQELAQSAALATGARAKMEAAQAELHRQEALAQAGIASQRDLEQARTAYAETVTELRSQQAQESLLRAGPRLQDVELARTQVQEARAALAAARTRATLSRLVAPFSGIVTQRLKNPGETVDPSTPVLRIVNPNKSLVEVQLSEDQVALVHTGDSATISADDASTIPAHVIGTSAVLVSETRTLTVRLRPDRHTELLSGASAKATIDIRRLRDAFVVSEDAVVKDPDTGEPLVYIKRGNGTYRRVPVRILLQSGSRIAIAASGLAAGQAIVTQGAYELLPFAAGSGND